MKYSKSKQSNTLDKKGIIIASTLVGAILLSGE